MVVAVVVVTGKGRMGKGVAAGNAVAVVDAPSDQPGAVAIIGRIEQHASISDPRLVTGILRICTGRVGWVIGSGTRCDGPDQKQRGGAGDHARR